MRILLVEDDKILGSSLKKALEKKAYGVDWFEDGQSGLIAIEDSGYQVAILDVNLPLLSGLEILKITRQKKNAIPIVMLTSRDSMLHKVDGLDSGADDYMIKPFDLDELFARIRALVRRKNGGTEMIMRCADVEIDPSAKVVRKASLPIAMTAKEFRVLKLLMERAGKYITKSDIEYSLYSAESAVESNTTEVTIYNLRKKLGSSFIQSIRGVGYMVGGHE